MIKEAIDRILDLSKPNIVPGFGAEFTDKKLSHITKPHPPAIAVSTLEGLVTAYKFFDSEEYSGKFFLVQQFNDAVLFGDVNPGGLLQREMLARAVFNAAPFPFGRFINLEEFIIAANHQFERTPDLERTLQFVSRIDMENKASFDDDGVSQTVTVRKGVTQREKATVPSPLILTPFRTFPEIPQPPSTCIFRINQVGQAALFAADNDAWKREAMIQIKLYISERLPDVPVIA